MRRGSELLGLFWELYLYQISIIELRIIYVHNGTIGKCDFAIMGNSMLYMDMPKQV